MSKYEEEKKDLEEFINGTVKELSKPNKEKVLWLIQGMIIGQSSVEESAQVNTPKRNQA